jgi:methylglyoxal reductase
VKPEPTLSMRRLGATGPEISTVGYGAWEAGGDEWGPTPPDEQLIAAMRAGFDAGINWVDTAEIYGAGRSEELVGRAIGDRDAMVFTKVAPAPRGSGFEPPDLRRAIQASLGRLRRDVIDVYQLHWPDPEIPVEGTWEGMARLVDDGLARMIGVSNFTENLIERCERIRHVDSLQPQLSMLWQERRPLLPFCACNGTGVIAYGPLAYGLLTGAITAETTFSDDDWRSGKRGLRAYEQLFASGRFEANLAVVDGLKPIARGLGVSLAQLALAWVLHQEGLTAAIAGSLSSEHVRENASASTIELSADALQEIEEVLASRGEVTVP